MFSHRAAVNRCLSQHAQQIADAVETHGDGPLVASMIRGIYRTALCNLGHDGARPWSECMLIADPAFRGDKPAALRQCCRDIERGGRA